MRGAFPLGALDDVMRADVDGVGHVFIIQPLCVVV